MSEKYCLKVIEGGRDDETCNSECFLLNKARLIIGNNAHCDIKVKSTTPEVAVVFQGFSLWFLKKISKEHEIFVNYEVINDSNGYRLEKDDVISLGSVTLKFTQHKQKQITMINEEVVAYGNGNCKNVDQILSPDPCKENCSEDFVNSAFAESNWEKPGGEIFPSENNGKNFVTNMENYLKLEKDYNVSQRYIASLESDIEMLPKYYASAFGKETKELISKVNKLEEENKSSQRYIASLESDYEELMNCCQRKNVNKIQDLETELRAAKVNLDNRCIESMVECNKLTLAIWQKDTELLAEKESTIKLQIQLEELKKSHEWTLYQKNYLEIKLANLQNTTSQVQEVRLKNQYISKSLVEMRAKFCNMRSKNVTLKRELEAKELELNKLIADSAAAEEKYQREAQDLRRQNDHLLISKNHLIKRNFAKAKELNGKLTIKEQELAKKISEFEDLRKKYDEDLTNALDREKFKNFKERDTKFESLGDSLEESFQKENKLSLKGYTDKLALGDKQIGDKMLNIVEQGEREKLCQKDKEIRHLKANEQVYLLRLHNFEKQVCELETEISERKNTLNAFRFIATSLEADINIQKRANEESLSEETARHLETKDKLSEKQKEVIELYRVFQNLQANSQERFLKHMENELNCAICSDLLNDAITLNCTHTFCCSCISAWKCNKNECPICRTNILHEVKVPAINKFIEKAKADMTDKSGQLL